MNPPQVYMCSPSWTLLPPPSPYHPCGSSHCTSPKHPVSCIEPGLASRFIHDILHVSMSFSQIFPPSPSPTESIRLFYTSASLGIISLSIINKLNDKSFWEYCRKISNIKFEEIVFVFNKKVFLFVKHSSVLFFQEYAFLYLQRVNDWVFPFKVILSRAIMYITITSSGKKNLLCYHLKTSLKNWRIPILT